MPKVSMTIRMHDQKHQSHNAQNETGCMGNDVDSFFGWRIALLCFYIFHLTIAFLPVFSMTINGEVRDRPSGWQPKPYLEHVRGPWHG